MLRDLSLAIRGECWVVHGANGSGKSSFMQLLYGDLGVASGGCVERGGTEPGVPIAQFKRRVGLVSPELQTLHPRGCVSMKSSPRAARASIGYDGRDRDAPARASRARGCSRAMRICWRSSGVRSRTLSYGQVRQVLFARALVREPDILLLDEPYAGLDAQPARGCARWSIRRCNRVSRS